MIKSIYSDDYEFLIKKLKQARIETKLTQKKVADMLGKTQSYIAKVEAGQLRIDVIQLKQFSKIYKKSLEYFIKE
jgi:transcriptional regulator with XRE-family HTH domain